MSRNERRREINDPTSQRPTAKSHNSQEPTPKDQLQRLLLYTRRVSCSSGPFNSNSAPRVDRLVEQLKQDRSVLAAVLCGSLSHDTVWAKSDIDLVLVTIDDRKVDRTGAGAVRRRPQRPRDPDVADGIPQDGRGLVPQLVHALAAREGAAALHARSDDRRPLREAGRARRARHADPAAAGRDLRRCRRSTRRTNGSSHAAISTTPRCGSSTRRRRWRKSR